MMTRPPGLAALHDALGCAAAAVELAFRGDGDSASLSLIEAHTAAEEAFGRGTPGLDALNVVLAAITQAMEGAPHAHVRKRPALVLEHLGRP
jgi:hypothetical protein